MKHETESGYIVEMTPHGTLLVDGIPRYVDSAKTEEIEAALPIMQRRMELRSGHCCGASGYGRGRDGWADMCPACWVHDAQRELEKRK